MKQFFLDNLNKIKSFFIRNAKIFLFILIFLFLTFLYNQNNQTLNFLLKRGIILEYSYSKEQKADSEKIKNELSNLGFKYSFIEEVDKSPLNEFDFDDKKIEKNLYIGLATLARKDKENIINSLSEYIFDNYPNSKLATIKTFNDYYNKPFNVFLRFMALIFISVFIEGIFICLFSPKKNIFSSLKAHLAEFTKKRKEDFSAFIKKTKEKGVGYFIKRLIFDDDTQNGSDMTKEIISTIVFVILCVIAIRYFIGELRWIPSGSMRPTILEHDRVFVEKLKYPKKEIERGDILVFYPPQETLSNSPIAIISRLSGIFCKDIAFIKRVIGLPEDKFEIKYNENNGEYRVYINDKALFEPYINSRQDWNPCNENMYCGPFIIPKGHYFMMGDNRGNSQDSRYWGFLDENRIVGRANFMFYPFSRINLLRDKYLNLHKQKTQNGFEDNKYIIDRYEFLYKI